MKPAHLEVRCARGARLHECVYIYGHSNLALNFFHLNLAWNYFPALWLSDSRLPRLTVLQQLSAAFDLHHPGDGVLELAPLLEFGWNCFDFPLAMWSGRIVPDRDCPTAAWESEMRTFWRSTYWAMAGKDGERRSRSAVWHAMLYSRDRNVGIELRCISPTARMWMRHRIVRCGVIAEGTIAGLRTVRFATAAVGVSSLKVLAGTNVDNPGDGHPGKRSKSARSDLFVQEAFDSYFTNGKLREIRNWCWALNVLYGISNQEWGPTTFEPF